MNHPSSEKRKLTRRSAIKSLGAASAALLGTGTLASTSAAASPSGVTLGETYKLLNVASSNAVDVANASTDDGADVHQWEYVGGANQQWTVEVAADGYYKLVNANSGKALDVAEASGDDGATVHQWEYVDGANQQWAIEDTDSGVYRLTARHSGKVLEAPSGALANGDDVQQWGDGGGDNQRWALFPVSDDSEADVTLANDDRWEEDGVGYVELDVTNEESSAIAINPTVEGYDSGVLNPGQSDIVLTSGETKRITVSFTDWNSDESIYLYVGDEDLVLQQVPYLAFPEENA